MSRGRPLYEPVKVQPEIFGAAFRIWWTSLQPVSRNFDGNGRLCRPSNIPTSEWKPLRKFHRHGFSLFMLGLSWWGHAVKGLSPAISPHFSDWQSQVEDVDWVLQQWLSEMPAIHGKRLAAPQTEVRASKRARR